MKLFKSYRLTKFLLELKYYVFEITHKKYILINAFLPIKDGSIGIYNFGDDLNINLINAISKQKIVPLQYSLLNKKSPNINYLCIGSYLHRSNNNSIIWGTGSIENSLPENFTYKKILAVRGPLTRNLLLNNGIECPEVYGDPSMLLPFYYKPTVSKKYKIGIIPHIVDKNNPAINIFSKTEGYTVIDIQHSGNWTDFIDKLCECEAILSSSLHGLILSDIYNIPNVWVEFSNKLIGNRFKFNDYFLSVNRVCDDPIFISKAFDLKYAQQLCKNWKPINIDLNPLIDACPFMLNKPNL